MTCNEQGTKTDTTPTRHASVRVSTTQRRQKTGRGGPERESESKRERGVDAELKKEVEGKREEKEGEGRREWQRGTMRRFTFDLSKRGGLPWGARARARPLWAE